MPEFAKSPVSENVIEDAAPDGWLIRQLPPGARPWLELMRIDRPIGSWLLLLPCWQGVALAMAARGSATAADLWLPVAFAIGAVAMRGAGCTLNDLLDRDLDRQVRRTRMRPLPSGRILPAQAVGLGLGLCLLGGAVLLTLNPAAIAIGLLALIPATLYPFAKRVTWWPQLALGIAFNWGALVGWTAVTGSLAPAALLLYLGGVCWTVGYDTIYALMDREDDVAAGIRSTARRFAGRVRPAIAVAYAGAAGLAAAAGILADLGPLFWAGLLAYGLHLGWQIRRLRPGDRGGCLRLFRSNRDAGLLLLLAIALGAWPAGSG